jgi:hypothetical protein
VYCLILRDRNREPASFRTEVKDVVTRFALEICGKAWGFRRCFTDQLKSYLNTNTNTLEAPNLDVPTGKYVIEIRIADEQGRETVANYKMVVAEAPKPSK